MSRTSATTIISTVSGVANCIRRKDQPPLPGSASKRLYLSASVFQAAGGLYSGSALRICSFPKRAQHHIVDEREDGGVGADAKRQRKHGYRGKTAILRQNAKGVANVFASVDHS